MKDLPPFPGKTWMTPSDAVWKERCSALNAYFHAVFSRPLLASNESVMAMFARSDGAEDWVPTASPINDVTEEDEKDRFKYVDIDTGIRIGYIDKGDSSLPLVLFVHGFPDTLWTWEAAMETISEKGFYCVSMAQRGYYPSALLPVKSEEPEWKRFGKHMLGRDVLGVVKALNKTNAVLIGHDFGATAVWSACVMDQQEGTGLVSKVIGEAVPPPKAIAFKSALIYKARHMVYYNTPLLDTIKGTKENNFVYLESLLDRWSPTWKRSNRTLTTVKRHFSMEGRTENAVAYYRGIVPPKEAKSIYDPLNLTDIKCPLLFICGEEESGGGMVEMFKQTAAQCAGCCEIVIVRDAGHFVHLEKPNAFMYKILPFLEMDKVSDGKQVKIKYVEQTRGPVQEPKKE
jgi:pimeloyl-ACP methyl ester carboxylesterase